MSGQRGRRSRSPPQTFTAPSINSGNRAPLRYSASVIVEDWKRSRNAADVSYGRSLTNLRKLCARNSRSHHSFTLSLDLSRYSYRAEKDTRPGVT